ncbi:MAG: SIR2 family NAD-dependent protein deacylase [Chitinophagaceae bacterium]
MKKLIIFSGAGISAESGLKTFRDSGGLWENFRIEEVATPEAWKQNPERVLRFYNERRQQAAQAQPNQAHRIIAELENHFSVDVITQNVDDLHERAGSSRVLHLHGELNSMRTEQEPYKRYRIEHDMDLNTVNEHGERLRPDIVWFGEAVPNMEYAIALAEAADYLVVVGSSLQVYPAASLLHYVPNTCQVFLVDPQIPEGLNPKIKTYALPATLGLPLLQAELLAQD